MKDKKIFFLIILFLISISSFSQAGKIQLNQDPKLSELMKLKKVVNQEDFTSGQYTIQVYNGTYEIGTELMKRLISENELKDVIFSFETPYYKIRIGKYVSKIEAIKELKNVKKTFPSAFILKPN
jgi:inner membrane protein involved in colicin E2 resistance